MAHRIQRGKAQPQKQPGAQAGWRSVIRLRFIPVGQHCIENMGSETGFSGMAGFAVFVSENAMQPTVSVAAIGEASSSCQGHILYRKGPATQPSGRFHVSPDEPLFRRWLRER